jgi:hypothetical protein
MGKEARMLSPTTTWEDLLAAANLLRTEGLTPTAFAAAEGVSRNTVVRRVQRGQLRQITLGRDVLLWRRDLKSAS